ncbi:MAG: prolipoprotein diacylglyceryl transferase [Deltaproteobacteria bacterium]
MYPEIIKIGNFTISSFGLMIALCFLVGYWIVSVEGKRKGLQDKLVSNMFLAAMIGGIVGAKLLYLFENVPVSELLRHPLENLLSRGGLTYYGGFFGAILLVWIIAYRGKLSMWVVGDLAAPALAIAYAIGRVGCLLVGDDYGVPSNLPWAMSFPEGLPPTTDTVHPTQLYEIIIMSIVFVYIWKIRKKVKPAGWLFSIYLILAGLERFFIEFIRNTTPSPIPGLSVAQVMALVIILIGAFKLYSLHSTAEKVPEPERPKKFGKKKKA